MIFLGCMVSALLTLSKGADGTTNHIFLRPYLEFSDAEQLRKAGDYLGASVEVRGATEYLKRLRARDPGWEASLVAERQKSGRAELKALEPLAENQILQMRRPHLAYAQKLFGEGQQLEHDGNNWNALKKFEECQVVLKVIQNKEAPRQAIQVEMRATQDQIVSLNSFLDQQSAPAKEDQTIQ